ncbi:uncharacterized protein LOC125021491 [Mugil cephalus]|uniref:uncharacterized protein LOC125021491 n=1 Tax=Mugil cephalus TaxID=48193 RepID=UPI001FB60F49|nr:uncharacterized protein LOC125021491 [Mugil cephalus]XP_047463544.1 uncharacterized protein LOC125021491 [Mugil cephalus]
MSRISEREWRDTLVSILEELDETQYEKTLSHLKKIKQSVKNGKSRFKMVDVIVQHYGLEGSINTISGIMKKLPRNDEDIQSLLRPFMDKLKKTKKMTSSSGFKKKRVVSNSGSSAYEDEAEADEPTSQQPVQEKKLPLWRKSIRDLKIDRDLGQKAIAGKVVQKSGLITYQTKTKEQKFFFYLGVADDTGSIKVMVYGKEFFQEFQEKTCYMFRNIIMDGDLMKVTKQSLYSVTSAINIPEDLELEARMLISQKPVSFIAKAKSYDDKTIVSVEGTVEEIGSIEHVSIKNKQRKTERLEFTIHDESDSITVKLWGKETSELRGKTVGDYVRVINVKTNRYNDTVSLNSTDYTKILKMQSAAVQDVDIQIIGIVNASRVETELDAEISGQIVGLVVESSLLAKAFGLRLSGNFRERLLEIMPLSAKAEINGSKIIRIVADTEM